MTAEESKAAGGGNVILQALARVWMLYRHRGEWDPLIEGDILILCTDGLWNMVDDAAIAETAARSAPKRHVNSLSTRRSQPADMTMCRWAYSSCARLPAGRPSRKGRRGRLRLLLKEAEARQSRRTAYQGVPGNCHETHRMIGQYQIVEQLATEAPAKSMRESTQSSAARWRSNSSAGACERPKLRRSFPRRGEKSRTSQSSQYRDALCAAAGR